MERRVASESALRAALAERDVLRLVHVRTEPRSDRELPRPDQTAPELAARFRAWLADRAGEHATLPCTFACLIANILSDRRPSYGA